MPEVLTFSAQPSGLHVALPETSLAPGEQLQVRVTGLLPESGSPSRRITLAVQGQGGLSKSASVTRLLLKGAMPVEESSLTLKGQLKFSVWPQVLPELQLSGRISNAVPGTVRLSLSRTSWSAGYQDPHLAFGIGHLAVSGLALQPGLEVFGVSAAVSRSQWWAKSSAGWQDGGFAGNLLLGYSGAQSSAALGFSTSTTSQTVAAQLSAHSKLLRGQVDGAVDLTTLAPSLQASLNYTDRLTALGIRAHYRAAEFSGQAEARLSVQVSARRQLGAGRLGSLSGDYQLDPVTPGAQATFSVAARLTDHGNTWSTSWQAGGGSAAGAGIDYASPRWSAGLAWTPAAATLQTRLALLAGPVTLRPSLSARLDLNTPGLFASASLQADWKYRLGVASFSLTSPTGQGDPWTVAGSTNLQIGAADVTLSAATAFGSGPPRTQLSAAVRYPLEVVTARRRDIGSLEGQVRSPDGRPLAGLRLRAGQLTALTDATGHFSFPDLHEGSVILDLLNPADAAGLRARPALPLKVTVQGQQVSHVEIELSPGKTVQGQLKMRWPTPQEMAGQLIVPEMPAPTELTVRLSGAKVSYETRINLDGTFLLQGVSSGTYEITLLVSGNKPLRTARLTQAVVVVPEDGAVALGLELIPNTRELHIEDAGELKLN